MKQFILGKNKYLENQVKGYYHCDYVGYQKEGNPDYINHLKNMTGNKNELDLVEDFITVAEIFTQDIQEIIKKENLANVTVCAVPRSKAESSYKQSQLMFKKAISSVVNQSKINNAINAIKRIKDTKTTHNWRLENNTGDSPYVGITKDTCKIDTNQINGKDIILVDDIYTVGVNIAEDCIRELFTLGAKSVTLYVIAKTKE